MNKIEYLKDKIIDYRYSLNIPEYITFGVEIEYENIVKDNVDYYIYEMKCNNNKYGNWRNSYEPDIEEVNKYNDTMNGEVKSAILKDTKQDWINLKNTLEILRKYNGIVTSKCGAHVNIGSQLLGGDLKSFRNFFLLWYLYEEEIYKFSSGEFNKVRICNSIKPIKIHLLLDEILKEYTGVFPYVHSFGDFLFDKKHDVSLNKFSSYSYQIDNVLEFRLPNPTLDEAILQNYINFFIKFLLSCKKNLDVEYTLYKIKTNNHDVFEFVDYVFDNDIDKEFFLIQTLKTNKIYKKELPEHKHYY